MGDLGSLSLNRLADLLTSPAPLVAGASLIAVVGGCAYSERWRWVAVGLLVFVAIPAPAVDFYGNWMPPPAPLDRLVLHARSATALMLVLVTAAFLVQGLAKQERNISPVLWWFLAMQVLLCLRHIIAGSRGEAFGRLGVYLLVFTAMGIGLTSLWGRSQHIVEPLKAIVLAAALYALSNAFIMGTALSAGFRQGRWFGITGNPNHAGLVVALFLPAMLGLLSFRGLRPHIRWCVLVLLALLVVQVLLTGSRGAVLTCVIGVVFFYRVRLGRMVLAVVPLGILTMVLLSIFGETDRNFGRLVSTENTRGAVYSSGIDRFLDNPIFGNPSGFFFVENGYLAIAMHTGLFGVAIILALVLAGIKLTYSAILARPLLGGYAPVSDAAIAGVAALAANNMVEATLLSNLSQTVFIVYLYVIVLQIAVRAASAVQELPPHLAGSYPAAS